MHCRQRGIRRERCSRSNTVLAWSISVHPLFPATLDKQYLAEIPNPKRTVCQLTMLKPHSHLQRLIAPKQANRALPPFCIACCRLLCERRLCRGKITAMSKSGASGTRTIRNLGPESPPSVMLARNAQALSWTSALYFTGHSCLSVQ